MPKEIEQSREVQSDSEIIENPIILVKKVENLLKKSRNKQGKEEFKTWILGEWKEINKALLQLPDDGKLDNNGYLVKKGGIPRQNERDGNHRTLVEDATKFKTFVGNNRLGVFMTFQSDPYAKDQCYMNISFFADSEKRDNLLGLTIEHQEIYRDGKYLLPNPKQIFEVKISPTIKLQKTQ
jgi:hypothetical protein